VRRIEKGAAARRIIDRPGVAFSPRICATKPPLFLWLWIGSSCDEVGLNAMPARAPRAVFIWCVALLLGQARSLPQAQAPEKSPHRPISFFIYTPGFSGAEHGDDAVRAQFQEFVDHLGSRSRYGSVGVALNYPYLAFVTGHGPASFAVDAARIKLYEANVRVAREMGLPVMVGFNGGPWGEPGGPFNSYWKAADGGRFLARYKDGQVNESLHSKGPLTKEELEPFLAVHPYDSNRQDALFLTLSTSATSYRRARLKVLDLALAEWQRIDRAYPGTIQAFTTDSEVCDFSFRSQPSGDALPIGYERAMTEPFCRRYGIADCGAFFRGRQFTYQSPEERHWYDFRVEAHRQFVADTVSAIRKRFPMTPIFTHQLGTVDGKVIENFRRQDWASPQETAFVNGANPGVTASIYGGRESEFRELVSQMSEKADGQGWALAEFNPGVDWHGNRAELSQFSFDLLRFLADHDVSMIALLAWNSNALDAGIKDTGVDDAVRRFLAEGPDAGNAR
jgi:hypothetical protein